MRSAFPPLVITTGCKWTTKTSCARAELGEKVSGRVHQRPFCHTGRRGRRLALAFVIQGLGSCVASRAAAEQPERAAAEQPEPAPAYQLKLELDLPIVLIGGATASSFAFMSELPGVACAPSCDKSRINRFDRFAAGLYDPTWRTVGDIATASTLVAPLLVVLVYEGWSNGLNDDLVIAEAALVTSALQVSMSYAIARPRPRVYGNEASLEQRTNANAARSFFSGHVANTVSISVATLRTFQRLGQPGLGWAMFGVGMAGSTLVGVSRVAGGSHFPSDVLVGAAMGVGVGLVLPAIHDSPVRMVPVASADYMGLLVRGAL